MIDVDEELFQKLDHIEIGEIESKKLKEFKQSFKRYFFNHSKTNIQCPDCGNLFIYNEEREVFCEICNRVFSESEVRARCGL